MRGFGAEDEEEFALEWEQQFHEVDKSCAGINPVWKKLAAWVPRLLDSYRLAFAEADGFFCMTARDKDTYLVAPRFCPRPARDVMGMKPYAFLLRSHGVLHDWRFREKPANRRAWRLADEDLQHEWCQITGAASQRFVQSSSLSALVAAVRSMGDLTFAQRAWLQVPEVPPLE